jgi:hypothetical protein
VAFYVRSVRSMGGVDDFVHGGSVVPGEGCVTGR